MTVGRGGRAIKDLLDLLPREVAVRRAEGVTRVAADTLGIGEIVVIKPGARVPVDGEVATGHSFVDQSAITGESLPVEKVPGTTVFAGTINQSGTLDVRATGIGRDTTFAKIVEAVEHAQESRAPIQKTADRLAGYLVYFALGAAVLTFILTRDARSTISVIIVAGACGIAAGTPLAILGAVGRAARHGAIVKGGIHIEVLGRVDTIVLDKTGTLTLGDLQIVAIHAAAGVDPKQLLEAAAIAELPSEHPLGKAVLARAKAAGITPLDPDRFSYTPDVARESADVVLLGNDLLKLVETLRIARRCRSIIGQNLVGTLLVDGAGVVLAAFGFLNPLLAAFIHVSSELLFILNATRLLPARRKESK